MKQTNQASDEESTSMIYLSEGSEDSSIAAECGPEEEKLALAVELKDISSSGSESESDTTKGLFSFASVMLIIAINFANFVNGLYMAVPGPTLLFLSERVSADVSEVSTILAGRSAGNLLGAFAATIISRGTTRYWNPTMKLGLSFVVYGFTTLMIPFVTNLWVLVAVLSVGGFLFGFNNTGFLAIQLDIWGEKKSRPLMQLYQGIFSIGAMLAPLIATPFLRMADNGEYTKLKAPACFEEEVSNATWQQQPMNVTGLSDAEDLSLKTMNPVTWVYVIIGSLSLLVSLFLVILSVGGAEVSARCGHSDRCEARAEESLRKVFVLLLCVIGFYAFQVAAVNVFASYIYSVAFCSKLRLSISEASSLNSMYWGVIIIGRLGAFLVASKLRPATLITTCVVTLILSSVTMSVFGESYEWIAWLASGGWALAVSPLFGSGVSWVSQITNVSGRYAVIFEIGSAIGAVGAFPVAGILFDDDPFNVIHFVGGLVAFLAIFYVGMRFTDRRHKTEEKLKKSKPIYIGDKESEI